MYMWRCKHHDLPVNPKMTEASRPYLLQVTATKELLTWQQDPASWGPVMVTLPSPPPGAVRVPHWVLRERGCEAGWGKLPSSQFSVEKTCAALQAEVSSTSEQAPCSFCCPAAPQQGRAALAAHVYTSMGHLQQSLLILFVSQHR